MKKILPVITGTALLMLASTGANAWWGNDDYWDGPWGGYGPWGYGYPGYWGGPWGYGYPGYWGGYPGWGYGYPAYGYGYTYPGYGYQAPATVQQPAQPAQSQPAAR